uniref:Glutathione gamma-glutamylcysteinyltransferase n=1 Tax=Poecilia formosa TaxID=48698 RepID=A0A096M6F1_POEFO
RMEAEPEDQEEEEAAAAMLWSIQEALERQTQQIGASACGATAVVDVLKALGVDVSPEEADRCVQTRLRRNESPLADYLLSRSEAGATHVQLIRGAQEASGGKAVGRFFHLYPRRRVRLVPWLASWIRKGAVPVATMNMQLAVPDGEEVPDAWHHQLIFGVAPRAVFMTNPLDVVDQPVGFSLVILLLIALSEQIKVVFTLSCTGAELSNKRGFQEVLVVFSPGQVRQMMLEEELEDGPRTAHVSIPAAYSSGVTLFALTGSDAAQQLLKAPELPLL